MKKLKIKYMKRKIYRSGVLPSEIRQTFGDMRFRKTWENAYQHYFPSKRRTIPIDNSRIQPFFRPVKRVSTPVNECNLIKLFLQDKPEKVTKKGIYQVPPKTTTPERERSESSPQTDTKGVGYKFSAHKIRDLDRQPKYDASDEGQLLLFNINIYINHALKSKRKPRRKAKSTSACKHQQLLLFDINSIEINIYKNSYEESRDSFAKEFPGVASMFEQWATI